MTHQTPPLTYFKFQYPWNRHINSTWEPSYGN